MSFLKETTCPVRPRVRLAWSRRYFVGRQGASGNSGEDGSRSHWIPNPLLKGLFALMLREWPQRGIEDFWTRHPLDVQGLLLDGPDLFGYIWDSALSTPPWYFWSVVNSLEPFMRARGYGRPDLIWNLLSGEPSTPYGWICGLPIFNSMPEKGKSTGDARFGIAESIPSLMKHWFPGSDCRLLHWRSRAGSSEAGYAFSPQSEFEGPIPPFDFAYSIGPVLKNLPLTRGIDPFDAITLHADCRTYSQLTWDDEFRIVEDGLYLRGGHWGRVVAFSTFLRYQDWVIGSLEPPDRLAVLFDKAFFCPVRKRVVIDAGNLCGAPLYLFSLRLESKSPNPEISLTRVGEREAQFWPAAEKAFRNFLLQ